MELSLTPELEQFVQDQTRNGRFGSANEVVLEALRVFEQQERTREAELREFQTELDQRLAASDRGEVVDPEAVFKRLWQKSRERRTQRS